MSGDIECCLLRNEVSLCYKQEEISASGVRKISLIQRKNKRFQTFVLENKQKH